MKSSESNESDVIAQLTAENAVADAQLAKDYRELISALESSEPPVVPAGLGAAIRTSADQLMQRRRRERRLAQFLFVCLVFLCAITLASRISVILELMEGMSGLLVFSVLLVAIVGVTSSFATTAPDRRALSNSL